MAEANSTTDEDTSASVLIVEDEADVAELYEIWLQEEYSVRIAHDGREALGKLDETVDVVLLDRRMPGISGDEVLEEIRAKELGCRVMVVSAVTPDFDVLEMGFDDYLTKPVNKEIILETAERMVRRTEYEDEVQELYQLSAKYGTLREAKTEAELRRNPKFRQLQEEIDRKCDEMDELVSDFEDGDFKASFRQLGRRE